MNESKDECCFDLGVGGCRALKEKECKGCKFRKTAKEFRDGKIAAADRLSRLGLKAVIEPAGKGKSIIKTYPADEVTE